MIYFVILGIVLVLAIVAAARLARGSAAAIGDMADLESRLVPVDLDAFSNLIDSREVSFLRQSLTRASFRRVQRARIAAAFFYVKDMAWNAAVLIKAGQLVLNSANAKPEAVTAAESMVSSALHLRLRALLALCELSAEYLVPSWNLSPVGFARRYDSLAISMSRVSALYRPELRPAVSTAV
jgi:hypothetical protein